MISVSFIFSLSFLGGNSLLPSHPPLCSILLVDPQFCQKCNEASDKTDKEKDEENHESFHREFLLRVINKGEDDVRKSNLKRNWVMLKVVQQSTYCQ